MFTFSYQQDTYVLLSKPLVFFTPLPYPSSKKAHLLDNSECGLAQQRTEREDCLHLASQTYCRFTGRIRLIRLSLRSEYLFAKHATAPFFVIQTFCVALWCLDGHWYYSLFTLFTLVAFGCTAVWQQVRTLTEFCSMSIEPCTIQCYLDGKRDKVHTDELLPGDLASLGECYIYRGNFYINI